MLVHTIHTKQVWESNDSKRKIWQVTLQAEDDKEYLLKTYSPHIGKMGFRGKVKSYENRFGDRFAKQIANAGTTSNPNAVKPKSHGYYRDDDAIKAQWAIGQAINLASVKMDKEAITMSVIEKYAVELFATVGRVKGDTPESEQTESTK